MDAKWLYPRRLPHILNGLFKVHFNLISMAEISLFVKNLDSPFLTKYQDLLI